MATTESPYNRVHQKYRKNMHSVQKDTNKTNRYHMKRITGKYNVFESRHENGYAIKHIAKTNLTRVKEDKASYAIGDVDGKPITSFDFVYVSNEAVGEKEPKIEVITKEGESRYFDVTSQKLTESVGIGVGTLGGVSSSGSVSPTNVASKTLSDFGGSQVDGDSIKYKDVGKEICTPMKHNITFIGGNYNTRRGSILGRPRHRKSK